MNNQIKELLHKQTPSANEPSFGLIYQKPHGVEIEWFLEVVNAFLKYGIRRSIYFWDDYETLVEMLYRFSDIDIINKVCTSSFKPSDVEVDSETKLEKTEEKIEEKIESPLSKENEVYATFPVPVSMILSETSEKVEYNEIKCGESDAWLNIPCSTTKCPYYSNHSYFNCGFDHKNPSVTSFEVIAEKLEIPLSEVISTYNDAIRKLQNTFFISSELIEPLWDLVPIEHLCSLCVVDIDTEEDKYKEYEDYIFCSNCISLYSLAGIKLIIKFRQELKDIITISGKKYTNFQTQAAALGIGVSVLQNLYNRVGINRRMSQSASRAYTITHPRPGRTILNLNTEYLLMEVLAAKKIFGDFDPKLTTKLKDLTKKIRSYGIDIKNAIPY